MKSNGRFICNEAADSPIQTVQLWEARAETPPQNAGTSLRITVFCPEAVPPLQSGGCGLTMQAFPAAEYLTNRSPCDIAGCRAILSGRIEWYFFQRNRSTLASSGLRGIAGLLEKRFVGIFHSQPVGLPARPASFLCAA